jgi:hypothetical protein
MSRVDQLVGRLQLDAGKRMHAVMARVGGQQYAEGVTLRPPNELFSAKTIASLIGVPVTLGHGGPVVGRVVSAAPEGGTHLVGEIEIDEQHLAAVRNAPPFLSGEWKGRYDPPDPKLADIFGGHHAVARDVTFLKMAVGVAAPRCGNACVRADCNDCCGACAVTEPNKEKESMKTNGDDKDTEIAALKAKLDAAEGRVAGLELREKLDEKKIDERTDAEHDALVVKATRLGIHEREIFDTRGNDTALRRKIFAKLSPKTDVSMRSDAWLKNAIEAVEDALPTAAQIVRGGMSPFRRDDGPPDPNQPASTPEEAALRADERSRRRNHGDSEAPRVQYADGESARKAMIARYKARYEPGPTEPAHTWHAARKERAK